ncbi:hypothetical protein ACJX0J_012114, partial [Zea mays]
EETATTNHEGGARVVHVWTFWNRNKPELDSACHEADELHDHRHSSQQPHASVHIHRRDLDKAGDGEAWQGQWACEAGGHPGRPRRRDASHLLQGPGDRVHAPARAHGRAQRRRPAQRRRWPWDVVCRRPGRGLLPRHHQLLQLRDLAVHPGASRGGVPVPLLHRGAGVPLRRGPVRAARALLPQGHGALEARPQRQALLVSLRGHRGVRFRLPAHVVVPAGAGAPLRGHVRPAHHRLRRGAQLSLPRRDLAPRD